MDGEVPAVWRKSDLSTEREPMTYDEFLDLVETIDKPLDAPVELHANPSMYDALRSQYPYPRFGREDMRIHDIPVVLDKAIPHVMPPTLIVFKTQEARAAWINAPQVCRWAWMRGLTYVEGMVHTDQGFPTEEQVSDALTKEVPPPDGMKVLYYLDDGFTEDIEDA